MNAIKRFVKLLTSPLMPIRLFATEESDHADDFDFSWTDEPSGYYDSEGNYLGDDAAAAEAAGVDTNYDEYSDDFGDVNIQTDGNGNILSAEYKDPETGGWKESIYDGDRNSAANNKKNEEAMQVFGASMTPETLAALNGANKADVSTVLEGAANGNPAAVAMATAMTGTVPDVDSLKGLGYTDEQIQTATEFATTLTQAIAEGKGPNAAWKEASNKTGDPYGTNARNQMFKDTVINAILTYGTLGLGTAAGIAAGANTFKTSKTAVQGVRGILNALGVGGRYAGKAGAVTVNTAARLLNDLDKGASAVSVISGLVNTGMTAADAKALVDAYQNEKKTGESGDDTAAKTTEPTPATTRTSEPEPAATPKSDPVITNNPFSEGEPDISIPKGPLEGTPLSGTGLPGHESEPTKEEAEDRGFENDDSGSDTMEETSQDAPTSGLGGDTFSNPNDDTGRTGWGLGEEDPNRANYDTDKWNRGMERVSTDVVSDEKCKAFINKTFKDDPVLIKAVKIMKTIK